MEAVANLLDLRRIGKGRRLRWRECERRRGVRDGGGVGDGVAWNGRAVIARKRKAERRRQGGRRNGLGKRSRSPRERGAPRAGRAVAVVEAEVDLVDGVGGEEGCCEGCSGGVIHDSAAAEVRCSQRALVHEGARLVTGGVPARAARGVDDGLRGKVDGKGWGRAVAALDEQRNRGVVNRRGGGGVPARHRECKPGAQWIPWMNLKIALL